MSKITIERETLKWAIRWHESRIWPGPDEVSVFDALRAALAAQPAEPTMDTVLRNAARRSATVIHPGRLAAQPAEPAYTHADVAEAHAKGYALGLRQVDRPQPAGAQQEPNMRHPKIQALIGKNARQHIWMMLVEQLVEDPHFETTAMDMEYWDTLHDKLKEKLTAAQPAPAAVPLTDEQIDDICWNFNCSNTPLVEYDRLIARAIEAAHGIAAAGDKP